MPIEYLPFIFFFIALFYSSVGFGGGSSYLALLSLHCSNFYEIRSTALLLNICVVSIGIIYSFKHHNIHFNKFWPFLILSIPLSFLGAQFRFSQHIFFMILGLSLVMSSCFLFAKYSNYQALKKQLSIGKKSLIGGSIGLLSGVSGIGGGIFLSPILNLLNWSNPKKVAALASIFIFANSISGLIGLILSDTFTINPLLIGRSLLAVLLGSMLGSYLTNKKLNLKLIGLLTATLILFVGIKICIQYGFTN